MKNLPLTPPHGLDELELRIYNALPRRWNDCNATIQRKAQYRIVLKAMILKEPAREAELLSYPVKYDIHYDE
jgi:hypothetical protein